MAGFIDILKKKSKQTKEQRARRSRGRTGDILNATRSERERIRAELGDDKFQEELRKQRILGGKR